MGDSLEPWTRVRVLVMALLVLIMMGLGPTTLFVDSLLQISSCCRLLVLLGLISDSSLWVRLGARLSSRLMVLLGLTLLRILVVCLDLNRSMTRIVLRLVTLLSMLVRCLLLRVWVTLRCSPLGRLRRMSVMLVGSSLVSDLSTSLAVRLVRGVFIFDNSVYLTMRARLWCVNLCAVSCIHVRAIL